MTATAHRGLADTGNQRRCPVCATSFLPHPRKPSQTYCTERCRAAAWRQRGRARRATPTITHDANHDAHEVQNPVADGDTRNEDMSSVAHEESTRTGETTAVQPAVQRCPHCRQPIALLTLIVPPAAAHVAVPEPPTVIGGRGYRTPAPDAIAPARGATP
jgi:hypothetical protein